jgi:hypothetical protein
LREEGIQQGVGRSRPPGQERPARPMVPPWATAKSPCLSSMAPVKAPFFVAEQLADEASFRRPEVIDNDLSAPRVRQILPNHLNDFKRHLQGVQFVLG